MRSIVGILASSIRAQRQRRNVKLLGWLTSLFIALLALFSVMFHWLMAREGQTHSWVTAVYWTFVTMSTLGFGDITFQSDAGRLFTIVVLLTGTMFLVVILPFTFIQFFFMPWMEAQEAAQTPRSLPPHTRGHVLLTRLGAIEESLLAMLDSAGIEAWIVANDVTEAGPLIDAGYRVMAGPLDDPQTWRNARAANAALVATTRPDTTNTNVAFTVRETAADVPIVATAAADAAVDILTMAGCSRVLQLSRMLGESMARRIAGRDGRARVVGEFDDLLIAEAVAAPELIGKTLAEVKLRQVAGVHAVGLWHRGRFDMAAPGMRIDPTSVLVLAGSRDQLARYDIRFANPDASEGHTIIIGGGRVGRATAAALAAEGRDYRIVEKEPSRVQDPERAVVGDAAELSVLTRAGIHECAAVVITTHDDDMNVYLTLYCRRLRPDVQILARSNRERNLSTLHRAGADLVMSYATTGATAIYNLLKRVDVLLVAEGLHIFRLDTPRELQGKRLADTDIRAATGCSVIAIGMGDHFDCNPDALHPLSAESDLVLVGDAEAESRFIERYGRGREAARTA